MLPPLALPAALAAIPAVEYRKVLYRTIRPQFLAPVPPNPLPTPLSGIGARLHGARYTPKGVFDTIYLAEDPMTAFIEFHSEALALIPTWTTSTACGCQ
jgi:RES domain-containing protein